MKIKSLAAEIFKFDGRDITLEWFAGSRIPPKSNISQVSAYCLYKNKLIIVRNKRGWGIPGGHPELGETIIESLARELEEEAGIQEGYSTKIIGWLKVSDPQNEGREGKESIQIRFLITINVLPVFVPDDEIFERKTIDLDDFSKYVSWAKSPTGKAQILTLKSNLI